VQRAVLYIYVIEVGRLVCGHSLFVVVVVGLVGWLVGRTKFIRFLQYRFVRHACARTAGRVNDEPTGAEGEYAVLGLRDD
jgi:hypothetical protein